MRHIRSATNCNPTVSQRDSSKRCAIGVIIIAFCASIFNAVHIVSAEETYSAGQPTCLFYSSFTGLLSSGVVAIAMEAKRWHLLYVLNELLLEMGLRCC